MRVDVLEHLAKAVERRRVADVPVGVLLSGVFFAFKVMRMMRVDVAYDAGTDTRVYSVSGQVFFASAEMFADRFDLRDTAVRVSLPAAGQQGAVRLNRSLNMWTGTFRIRTQNRC